MTYGGSTKLFVNDVIIKFLGIVKDERKRLKRNETDEGKSHKKFMFLDSMQQALEQHIKDDNQIFTSDFIPDKKLINCFKELGLSSNLSILLNYLIVVNRPVTNKDFLSAYPMPRTESYTLVRKLMGLGLAFEEPFKVMGNSSQISRYIFLPEEPDVLISDFVDRKIIQIRQVLKETLNNVYRVKELK